MTRLTRTFLVCFAIACSAAAKAAPDGEVRAAFERFVQVQNAHDAKALAGLLADSPEFLWTTRGTAVWGRDAALARFSKLYEGSWKLEPELAALKVVSLAQDVAQLHVPVVFTTGSAGQEPQRVRMFINQVWVKAGGQWRVMSIFPVPAPAP